MPVSRCVVVLGRALPLTTRLKEPTLLFELCSGKHKTFLNLGCGLAWRIWLLVADRVLPTGISFPSSHFLGVAILFLPESPRFAYKTSISSQYEAI